MAEKTSKIPSNWRAIRVKSPAGTWYIARSHDEAVKMVEKSRVDEDGNKVARAVFFREELRHSLPKLEKLSAEDRQDWLREIIQIKQTLKSATVTKVTLRNIKYS